MADDERNEKGKNLSLQVFQAIGDRPDLNGLSRPGFINLSLYFLYLSLLSRIRYFFKLS